MMRMALTGGIASGKTFVADELASLGATIIDSDLLAREVVEPGTEGLAAVVERFGRAILRRDGGLDRPALGRVVFSDEAARADLNAIIHPRVRRLADERDAAAPRGVVVHVIPLLLEAGLVDGFTHIMVVDVPETMQLARLQERDGVDEQQAAARIDAQASRGERLAVADWVIDNSGTPEATRQQIRDWWREWCGPGAGEGSAEGVRSR